MSQTTSSTFDRRIADWLASDPNEAPEAVLRSVLADLPSVRQRRRVRRGWRTGPSSRGIALGLGGAAMAVLAIVAVNLVQRADETVGPSATRPASGAPSQLPSQLPSGAPTLTRRFRSTVHGYAAFYPAGWAVEPATTDWHPAIDDVIQPTAMDVFAPSPGTRGFVAASTVLPDGLSLDDWIERTLPPRQGARLRSCDNPSAGGTTMGLPPERWVPRSLGSYEARERDSCFTIDVVAMVGRRVYLFTGTSPRPIQTPADERTTFDAFLASVVFDETAIVAPSSVTTPSPEPTPIDLSGTWTSTRYGYDARYPASWTVAPATATAKLDRSMPFPERFAPETMDVYSDGLVEHLWVVSMPIAATANLDAWVAVHFPRRQLDQTNRCEGRSTPVSEAWVPVTVGGRPGRERDICGRIDVVFVGGSRAYVISGRSPTAFSTPLVDRATLDAFVASIDVHPEAATAEPSVAPYIPKTTYTSTLYGYSIDAPWDLDVIPGKTAWKPGENWSARGVADRFDRRGGFTIVSTTLPRGVSLDDWIAVNLPGPRPSGGACRFGFAIVGVPTGPWQQADLGGHPGRIRDGCEVDGVVAVGHRVYVISSRSLEPGRRMRNLVEIAQYIDFRPKDATAP